MLKMLFNELIKRLYFKQKGNLALFDQLTEVYNYNWLHIVAAKKYLRKEVYITVIDVNNFKQINDSEGHVRGNMVLQNIAKQLVQLKAFDSSLEVIRYGGDEFVVISEFDISGLMEVVNERDKLISYGICKKLPDQHISVAFAKADDEMYKYKMNLKKEQCNNKSFKFIRA